MFRYPNRLRVTVEESGEIITKQSMAAECDINNIMTQFKKTGIITHMSQAKANYAELPPEMDYQESLHVIMQAEAAFDELPSVVRRAFANDPAQLLAALGDPSRRPELEELGVLNPKPTPRPPGRPETILPSQNPPTLRTPNDGREAINREVPVASRETQS